MDSASSAIIENDPIKLRSALARAITEEDECTLLDFASELRDTKCRAEVLKILVGDKELPTSCGLAAMNLASFALKRCPDDVLAVGEELGPAARAASAGFFYYKGPLAAKDAPAWKSSANNLILLNQPECDRLGQDSPPCEAIRKIKMAIAELDKEQAQGMAMIADQKRREEDQVRAQKEHEERERAKERDPNRIAFRACRAKEEIARLKKLIAREHEVGRKSGSINLAALNDFGQAEVSEEDFLKDQRSKYQGLTGKTLSFSICSSLPTFDDE